MKPATRTGFNHRVAADDHRQQGGSICNLTTSARQLTVSITRGEMNLPRVSKPEAKGIEIMGDKSPKAVHKQAAQKQIKADAANQKKQQAVAAKQSAIKMK